MSKKKIFLQFFQTMPRIIHYSLVNLTAFRQRNGLLQKDIAEYLGVTRSYVSMVEKGSSKFSRENLDKLYDNPYHWNVDDLVPAYTRVNKALLYLNQTRNEKRAAEGLLPSLFTFGYPDEEELIKYGESTIPEYLVDSWCEHAPELNPEWLLTGEGEMFVQEGQEEPAPIELLQEKVDKLEAAIEDYKRTVEQLVESLPQKIVEALQAMSKT